MKGKQQQRLQREKKIPKQTSVLMKAVLVGVGGNKGPEVCLYKIFMLKFQQTEEEKQCFF